jgi:hypothetical protein
MSDMYVSSRNLKYVIWLHFPCLRGTSADSYALFLTTQLVGQRGGNVVMFNTNYFTAKSKEEMKTNLVLVKFTLQLK